MQFLEGHGKSEDVHKSKNKGWLLWGGLVFVIAIAIGGYFVWQSLSEEPPVEPTPAPAPPPAPEPEPEPEPEPPTETAPTTGSLVVSSNREAVVFINNQQAGKAPYRESGMEPGVYNVRVVTEGFGPFEKDVRVSAGATARVTATFEKQSAVALRITSDVPGATVFIDRDYAGTTPLEITDIAPGTHELTASVDGYDMYAETIEIADEPRDVTIRFRNVELNEQVAVVHKHTFGQCEGILKATLTHVIYETDHKDAFSAPWAALQQFEVDYIAKNLNIRIQGGKNYNFTSQSGNPDDLYVFHQKVTEAREKLRAISQ